MRAHHGCVFSWFEVAQEAVCTRVYASSPRLDSSGPEISHEIGFLKEASVCRELGERGSQRLLAQWWLFFLRNHDGRGERYQRLPDQL